MKRIVLLLFLLCNLPHTFVFISAKTNFATAPWVGDQSSTRQRRSFLGGGYADGLWKAGSDATKPRLEDFIEGTVHYNQGSEKYDGTYKDGRPYNGEFDIDYGGYVINGKGFVAKGKVVNGGYYGTVKGQLADWGLLSISDLNLPEGVSYFDMKLNGDERIGVIRVGGYEKARDRGSEYTGTMVNGKWIGEVNIKYTNWDYTNKSIDLLWNRQTDSGTGTAKTRNIVSDRVLNTPFTFKTVDNTTSFYTETGDLLFRTTKDFRAWNVLDELLDKCASWTANRIENDSKQQTADMAKKIASNRASYKSQAISFDAILRSWNNTVRENPYYHKSFPIRLTIDEISTLGIVGMNNKYCLRGKSGNIKYCIGSDDEALTRLEYPATIYLYVEYYDKSSDSHYFRNAIYISK